MRGNWILTIKGTLKQFVLCFVSCLQKKTGYYFGYLSLIRNRELIGVAGSLVNQ